MGKKVITSKLQIVMLISYIINANKDSSISPVVPKVHENPMCPAYCGQNFPSLLETYAGRVGVTVPGLNVTLAMQGGNKATCDVQYSVYRCYTVSGSAMIHGVIVPSWCQRVGRIVKPRD